MKKIRERGNLRGLVPSRKNGHDDKPYNEYLNALEPEKRLDIQLALAMCPDIRFKTFLQRMGQHNPAGYKISYAATAKACNIGLEEFGDWFAKGSTQKAIALFQVQKADLTAQMIEAAKNRIVGCERCDGLGWIDAEEGLPMDTPGYKIRRIVTTKAKDEDGQETEKEVPVYSRTCPAGCVEGKVLKVGDDFRLEKSLEMAGLINQKGPGFQITQNFGGAGMGNASTRLNQSMTIDVEPE